MAKVVGLNYQLIDEPTVPEKDRAKVDVAQKPKPGRQKPAEVSSLLKLKEAAQRPPSPKPVVQKPKPREFIVRVRRSVSIEEEIKVKALDQPAAEQMAVERAKRKPFKPGKALQTEIVRTAER